MTFEVTVDPNTSRQTSCVCPRLPEHPTRRKETERGTEGEQHQQSVKAPLLPTLAFSSGLLEDFRAEAAMELPRRNVSVLVGVYLWATFYYRGGLLSGGFLSVIQDTFIKRLMFPYRFSLVASSGRKGESLLLSCQMWPHLAREAAYHGRISFQWIYA